MQFLKSIAAFVSQPFLIVMFNFAMMLSWAVRDEVFKPVVEGLVNDWDQDDIDRWADDERNIPVLWFLRPKIQIIKNAARELKAEQERIMQIVDRLKEEREAQDVSKSTKI